MSGLPTVAYLADGKLYTKAPNQPARLIESPFVQGIIDRVNRSRERNEWKQQGMAWNFTRARAGMGGMFPGGGAVPAETRRFRFTGISAGQGGQLMYALDTDYVGGLFAFDPADGSERRLLHKSQFRATDLCHHPAKDLLAFSLRGDDGTAHVAVVEGDSRGAREVTEGDAVDEAPSWAAEADGRVLVFQSAGVGRNGAGFPVGLGPYAIHKLDLDRDQFVTLAEDDGFDYLLPRLAAGHVLYYIRRPYQPHGEPVSPWKLALDFLLFPIRLVTAIVHFLNFFSMMFSRKPLMTAGGPPREGPDARYLMLWGRVVDTEKALRKGKGDQGKSLVPSSWELIRRAGDGAEEVLAKGVLAFDLAPGGAVVYSNGSTITHRAADGTTTEVGTGKMVERVAVVG